VGASLPAATLPAPTAGSGSVPGSGGAGNPLPLMAVLPVLAAIAAAGLGVTLGEPLLRLPTLALAPPARPG
jgi:hypothetical protein